jgi:hypothetical protein
LHCDVVQVQSWPLAVLAVYSWQVAAVAVRLLLATPQLRPQSTALVALSVILPTVHVVTLPKQSVGVPSSVGELHTP